MKTLRIAAFLLLAAAVLAGVSPAYAHVPYIERQDYTDEDPAVVRNVEQSKAFYAWLQTADDVDVYRLEVQGPTRLFAQVIVPVCPGYEQFLPSFAVIGPGLPDPTEELPVLLPEGYGAIVVPNVAPGEPRDTFYEPFGNKRYYDGPLFDQMTETPGDWELITWDPYGMGGDYVAVVGAGEQFALGDVLRSIINTRIIRKGGELHTDC